MPKFVAHVQGLSQKHRLVAFDVPSEHLEGLKDYNEIVEGAGWWYMNRCDSMSCIGPYEWCIFPYDTLAAFTTA